MKKKESEKKQILDILTRYALVILLSLNSLYVFYFVFKPLTFFPSALILSLIYSAEIIGLEKIIIGNHEIAFVNACVAGSAYYLLALLNLSSSGISWINRFKIFFINSVFLLSVNIIRIIILAVFLVNSSYLFSTLHYLFWHFVSIALVAGMWIYTLKFYKIKSIPIFTDMQKILRSIKK